MTNELLLISIAFNKPYLIEHQIRLIKKYLLDSHVFVVTDNSSIKEARIEISRICKEGGVEYFPAPEFHGDGCQGHGTCINWSCNNVVRVSGKKYFGFLDHDVFPIKPTSIVKNMNESGMMGPISLHVKEGGKWYMWPGFCFYDRSIIGNIDLNFKPVPGLDTGGGNYDILYYKTDMLSLPKMMATTEKCFREHPAKIRQQDAYFLMGPAEEGYSWVHTFNGSGWIPDSPGTIPKEDLVKRYLNSL